MADITYTNKATVRRAETSVSSGNGIAYKVTALDSTIELAASASGTTVKFGRIPSNARILVDSRIYNDDLATSGSPTLSLGLGSVNSNLTSLATALTSGVALSTASTANVGTMALADFASAGKQAWDLAGASSDPGGDLDVYATVKAAATTATGTITLALRYVVD